MKGRKPHVTVGSDRARPAPPTDAVTPVAGTAVDREGQVSVRRVAPRAVVIGAVVFAVVWILFWATGTNFGPAVHDPANFVVTLLNGLTFAGLLFIVASGFALIFGLMRVINMAQGAFFLLGGYIAYEMQQAMGHGGGLTCSRRDVNAWEWVVPAVVATLASASSASPCSSSSCAGIRGRSCARR